jgi:pilus assembly protein CpaF
MFSKYKKSDAAAASKDGGNVTQMKAAAAPVEAPVAAPSKPAPAQSMRKPMAAAAASPADKELKRKQRMQEIKLELHRALLDSLNLAALETATETELRSEISAIASEVLEEKGIVLNREDRTP